MDKLLSTVQKKGESMRDYIERFRNLSLMCPAEMPLPMLLQTYRHNFLYFQCQENKTFSLLLFS